MNAADIADLFIKAAVIDRRLPIQARPARLKCSWIPFVHSEADVKSRIKTGISFGDFKEHLHRDDNPFEDWVEKWWDEENQRLKPEDIAGWERANELIRLVASEQNRRALWHWAMAKAASPIFAARTKKRKSKRFKQTVTIQTGKTSEVSFVGWCRSEGIHEMTGTRRKDRAIAVIEQHLVRGSSSNSVSGQFGVLPVGAVSEHISDMIGAGSVSEEGLRSIMDDTAFSPIGVLGERDFSWALARNEIRRQREADRRKRQAA